MQILFQPFADISMGEFIIEALSGACGDFHLFQAAVAFAKKSGVQHVEAQLKEFVGNGKDARIVVGVDLNGTTVEGLESLLDALGDNGDLFVNHDENMFVTFHPKTYFFESVDMALLIIGSGNLTAGGLYSNDEGFAIMELKKSNLDDQAVIDQYKENFEKWCDEESELVRKIADKDDIQALMNAGYILNEAFVPFEADESAEGAVGRDQDEEDASEQIGKGKEPKAQVTPRLFGRMQGRKRAPRRRVSPTVRPRTKQKPQLKPQDTAPMAGNLVFVMTLQRTDVGTGQTTSGTSRRSPEIFIPLTARDEEPDFWGWEHLFADDPATAGKKDRNNVKMRLGGEIINVNMFYNDVKKDLRLRSEALRSSGEIDDIIKIEKTDGSQGFDYYVEIIPQSTGDYPHYRAACINKVKGLSKKYWGYYTTA